MEPANDLITEGWTKGKWISLKDAVPPLDKSVLITDGSGAVSFGRIYKMSVGYTAVGSKPVGCYEWKTIEPYMHNPSHWLPLPRCTEQK